jgi:hypothetical protein
MKSKKTPHLRESEYVVPSADEVVYFPVSVLYLSYIKKAVLILIML